MNLQQLLQYLASSMGWAVRFEYDGSAHVEIATQPGRTQVVHVANGFDAEREPIVFVWSPACDWTSARDPWALMRHSIALSYGAVALKDTQIVVKHSLRLATADEQSMRKAIFFVGQAADQLEMEAHGYADRL